MKPVIVKRENLTDRLFAANNYTLHSLLFYSVPKYVFYDFPDLNLVNFDDVFNKLQTYY